MMHLITLVTENIFAVIGLILYAGLVYYMIGKAFRHYSGNAKKKKGSARDSRKNFSRNLPAGSGFQDQAPARSGPRS